MLPKRVVCSCEPLSFFVVLIKVDACEISSKIEKREVIINLSLAAYGGKYMLQIKNLTITHVKDNRALLQDLNFVLNDGDKAAIIGEEGNGKSTLLKLIYDETLVENYVEYSGEIIRKQMHIGYLPQELPIEKKESTVYEFMCETPLFYEIASGELAQISRQLHIPLEIFYSDQLLRQLSGGEKIKLQLARLMINKPDVLLLDEPSNDLDIATVEWLEQFIEECIIPVLYISHDEMLLENTANMVIHLEQIRRKTQPRATVAKLGYKDYVSQRNSGLAHQEQVARKERSDYAKQQEKFRQIQQKVEHQQNAITRQNPHGGALLKKTMHRVKAYEARFEKQYENMTELPEIEDAIFIKFGADASVPNGKVVLDFKQTPVEFLTVIGSKEENSKIRTYLGSMKYTPDEMNHPIADLSGGQKAKLLLLQMSMSGSNVLILDEPTRNFSPLSNPVIRQMLKGFDGAILSISHDRKYIKEVAEKVYELTEKGLELKKE